MNAFGLVDLLLEADQSGAGNRTGVYVFGPDLPSKGYNAPDLETIVDNFRRYGMITPQASGVDMLNDLTQMGYTFFFKKDAANVEVIGPIPAHTTKEGQERAAQYLGLDRKEKVQYRQTPTSSPQEMLVDYVLFGSKELERDEREQKKAAKDQRSVPTKEFGQVDPQEVGFNPPAHPVGYSGGNEDFVEMNAPAYLGVVYDHESTQGIALKEIIPGGPAAQAGLLAGEVIVKGDYFSKKFQKQLGPFYLYTAKDLEKLLSRADINYPVHLVVVRGHGDTETVPVKLEPKPAKQGGPEMTIPAQEVQASARKPRKKAVKPAAVQKSFARKLFRPNEQPPASETGNNPANVSSLS